MRIAKSTITVGIPQQTVALVGEHKGNADLRVILKQVLILSLHIQFLTLVLSQSVKRLVLGRVELHLPRETMFMFLWYRIARLHAQFAFRHGEVPELLTILRLLQQLLAVGIEKRHPAISLLHHSLHFIGLHHHTRIFIRHRVTTLVWSSLRHNHQ